MSNFDDWCNEEEKAVNGHDLILLTTDDEGAKIGIDCVSAVIPDHYVAENRYARQLKLLGKHGAAEYLEEKYPTSKSVKSGDLGEILATSYIEEITIWDETVHRLRWKDHRNMAMRGEDMLAVGVSKKGRTLLLKGESKSRASLKTATVLEARTSLNSHDGRPSPHALAFLSDRLHEEGRFNIADRITLAQYKDGIKLNQVTHMLFTFSGNDPENFLTTDLKGYSGGVDQFSVGLRVEAHQDFIHATFEKAINGDA